MTMFGGNSRACIFYNQCPCMCSSNSLKKKDIVGMWREEGGGGGGMLPR